MNEVIPQLNAATTYPRVKDKKRREVTERRLRRGVRQIKRLKAYFTVL